MDTDKNDFILFSDIVIIRMDILLPIARKPLYRTHKHLCERCGTRCHIVYETQTTDCMCTFNHIEIGCYDNMIKKQIKDREKTKSKYL